MVSMAARHRALEFQPFCRDSTALLGFATPRGCPKQTRTATVTVNTDHQDCLATRLDDENMPERLKKFRVENQLQLPRFVQTLLETARWPPGTRQRPQWTLPQTAMPENVFHDVSLTAFDETDDFHP